MRGKHVMKGYWNRPEATAEAIRDGWLHTGDIATVDADGFVFINDRKKDMIISGGENIYPAEIENVILAHPKVREVAVIGQASAKWGESPLAVVVKQDASLTRGRGRRMEPRQARRLQAPEAPYASSTRSRATRRARS